MSRNTFTVSRAKGQLGRIKNSIRNMKKDATNAAVILDEDLHRWERHYEDEVTLRERVVARRAAAREEKKKNPPTKEQQMIAFRGKMRSGMMVGQK